MFSLAAYLPAIQCATLM